MIALTFPRFGEPLLRASRSMSPVDSWIMPRVACSRAACVPLPAPGGPKRMMLIIAGAPLPARRSVPTCRLELRLLDQVTILVGDQVALDLADGVHGDV